MKAKTQSIAFLFLLLSFFGSSVQAGPIHWLRHHKKIIVAAAVGTAVAVAATRQHAGSPSLKPRPIPCTTVCK